MKWNTVCLCGSTRFLKEFEEANIELTKRGLSVISISMCLPRNEQHEQEDKSLKLLLDLIHLNKILRADAIFIVGDGYFGTSTAREIIWADMQGKAIHTGLYLSWPLISSSWDTIALRIRSGMWNRVIVEEADKVLKSNG